MNTKVVFNFLGRILIGFSAIFVFPLIVALVFGENFQPFLYAGVLSCIVGLVLYSIKPENELLRFKESFAIVGLSWLLISIVGSIPYLFVGASFVDAFFESISGFTTTGASIFDKPEVLPKSVLFWRSMTQWLGGIGIIMLFVVVFPTMAKGVLFQAEYPGITLSKLKPRIRDTAIILYGIYLLLTSAEVLALCLLGVPIYDAVTHAFTTLSTGGFSTHTESIAFFRNPAVEFVVAFFALLGGMNFTIHYYVLKGRFKILKDSEFRVYVSIVVFATAILTILNLDRFDAFNSFRYSFFQVASIITTTGYTTFDFDEWCDGAKMILLILMFVGGCSGSTGGGIKVIRIYILIRYAILQIFKAAEPKTVRAVKYGETTIKKEVVESVVAFFILYVLIFVLSSLAVSLSGYDMVTSLSAVVASLSNVGPGMGLAGASETYSAFPDHVKLLLTFNMWLGRLEIYTVLALFNPSFWRERW